MPLRRFRRQYEQLSQFGRRRIISMTEAVWSARRVARQLRCSDCVVRRCWDQWIRDMSLKRRPGPGCPRQTSLILGCQVIYSQFGLAIHQNNHQARRRFVEGAQNEIAVGRDFHKRILFSDEVHFWLNGYVNKQNCRIWREANSQVYVETPLHPEKLTVCYDTAEKSEVPPVYINVSISQSVNCPDVYIRLSESTASSAAIQAKVAPSLGIPVSSRTIRRCLAEGHLGSRHPLHVLPLTPTYRRLRLEWCHARGNCTAA
ncbi:transposable element Tcb2 transposase [Trichonephila clavipes]|nr:transposable element Tcb2 transposase [Trichonephila clavipes]